VDRGIRGEVNATVELTAGLHYLEYYHEEVTLEQMAYLGWRPSADAGPFSPIPETVYTAPHAAVVRRYEDAAGKALPTFEPVISDSVWPTERHTGQYTRCRFKADAAALPQGTKFAWEFGDGQSATGAEAEHVYLALGTFTVKLTETGPGGAQTAAWPLQVFELEHVTEEFKEGKPQEYAKLARTYDRAKLDAASLAELAHLFAECDEADEAVTVGKAYVERFKNGKPLELARMRRLLADCALRQKKGSVDDAIANYQKALVKEMPAAEKLDVLARLIRLLGIERELPDKAEAVLKQVEEVVKAAEIDDEVRAAYCRALIAAGDARLWQGKTEGATELYGRAERESGRVIPQAVRVARIGSYPNALRDYIASGNYGAALDVVDRWEQTFPTEKPKGHTFFWRGKLLALRGNPREAERYLDRAVRLAAGASFETEARWLLAESLDKLGRKGDARRELAKLVATGLNDDFTRRAKAKLKK
jgi:tetratricopeptide (TPR) repeat protein